LKYLISIFFLSASVAGFSQSTGEQELTTTVKEFHQALVKKDLISLNRHTDEALSYGHSNGWVETKADFIKDLETDFISYQRINEDSITIAINGDMANVRFVAEVTVSLKGATSSFRLKVLEVWVKKGEGWVLFGRQAVKA
jgi:Domain of unknown function (DUF4440)